MRKIFNTLEETTQKPCSTETADFEAAKEAWSDEFIVFLSLEVNNQNLIADFEYIKNLIPKIKNANENIAKTVKEAFVEIGKLKKEIPTANNYQKVLLAVKITELQDKIIKYNKIRDCIQRQIPSSVISDYEIEIANNEKNIQNQFAQVKIAETAMNDASSALSECLSSPLHIRLNLNPPCKELKQNIKIVNQKSISLNNKLINLNSGVSSLEILNINKDFFDKNIKNTKEFITLLDKLNPNPNPSNSSFLNIYKKAQEDLASHQEKRKMLRKKIKTSEEKIKTIPDKKNALEDKIYNKIQKFVNCKTPTVI